MQEGSRMPKEPTSEISRRQFVKQAASASVAAGSAALLAGCQDSTSGGGSTPNINTDKTFKWKMVTTWPSTLKVLGEGAKLLAGWIETMSQGRLQIKVYGAGELVPALGIFEAVSQGAAQMGHGASYYWAGSSQAAQFFAAVPFGMNAQQMNAWIYSGGGLELWEKVYKPFGLLPMPAGNTGVQMGGWFNREINSIDDFKGMKMRIPGLGGKVLAKAGGAAVLKPGGEIYTSLERGLIDATEWIGPYHDYHMGFHRVAKYYYYPGWHEPGTVLELFVNREAFEELPADLQEIVRTATYRSNMWMLSEFESKNNMYLDKLINEHDVQLRKFPDDVLAKLKVYSQETIEEICASDPLSAEVYDSFKKFQKAVNSWAEISERAYYGLT
jgi:TRAP-type mannitol/chloroaromatic compound transport system substrate-binding protein